MINLGTVLSGSSVVAVFAASAVALGTAGCADMPSSAATPMSSSMTTSPSSTTSGLSAATPSVTTVGASTSVPAALQTPPSQALFLLATGKGVQIYDCTASPTNAGTYAWTFRSPEASLTDTSGATVAKHYAGPTWESPDGSTVVGTVSASSPSPSASSIPWLLLAVKSTTGSGVFTQTKSVQRLQTVGGVAPADGCTSATTGQVARVPYTATYAFFKVNP